MLEKVVQLKLPLSAEFIYSLAEDGVYRVAAKSLKSGELRPAKGAEPELFRPRDWEWAPEFDYKIDEQGDIVRFRSCPRLNADGERTLPELAEDRVDTDIVAPKRIWLMSLPDDVEIDALVVAGRKQLISYDGDAPDFKVGDGLILWAKAPHHCVVGLATIDGDVKREKKRVEIQPRFLCNTLRRPLFADELVYDQVLQALPQMTSRETVADALLDDKSALRILTYAAERNPIVRAVVDVWMAPIRERLGDSSTVTWDAIERRDSIVAAAQPDTVSIVEGQEYRVLSVWPAWAWAIVYAGKSVENRSWNTPYRGSILIHASSKKISTKELEETRREIATKAGLPLEEVPTEFPSRQIIGMVDLIDCVPSSRSPWAQRGAQHWVLSNSRKLDRPIEEVDGKLSLWKWSSSGSQKSGYRAERGDALEPSISTTTSQQKTKQKVPAVGGGRSPNLARALLRKLSIEDVRRVVDHYKVPRARSIEEMLTPILRKTGRDLSKLVSHDGPFTTDHWNQILIKTLGGQAHRSFEAVREAMSFRLDRAVEEFDMDESVFELREQTAAVRRLAQLLDIDRDALTARLQDTHGRTLLGRFISDLRKEQAQASSASALDLADDDDEADDGRAEDIDNSDVRDVLTRLLHDSVEITDIARTWPSVGKILMGERVFDVNIYARIIGGSSRGNTLERRFQNPSQQSPIVDDPNRYELLFGLWVEQGYERAVVVAFDPYRRLGRESRFSLFMPLSLLEQAADTGFATHENARGEVLYAFRPENLGRYVQGQIELGLWMLQAKLPEAPSPKRLETTKTTPKPQTAEPVTEDGLFIRPRVGMYAAFARLNYKPWFALAEFVDNSIQSFIHHRDALVAAGHDGPLVIDLNIEDSEISITDRAGGIAWKDLPRAFSPAAPPDDPSGLSEFGLGMKAAACWFSRKWSVRTSALGEPVERTVRFDIPKIAKEGIERLPIETQPARQSDHFTVLTLSDLRVHPRGRTLQKIREHLASIYRVLIDDGTVKIRLTTSGKTEELMYQRPQLLEAPYHRAKGSTPRLWKQEFAIDLHDRTVKGWAGILRRGSHATAGFSVFRRRRLIEGSIGETYKPMTIFGNPNSFAYQRVVGEIFVEGFDVTHTKDGIQWQGYEDEVLESIRSQINSPSSPLLDQADGYRARLTADTLPSSFGVEALADTVEALRQPGTSAALFDQAEPGVDGVPEVGASVETPHVKQSGELKIQVLREGKPWNVHIELIYDSQLPFYSVATEMRETEEVLVVRVNLDHEFSVAFINNNEASLQPVLRLIAALALGERLAREGGAKNTSTVRLNANAILKSLAAEGSG